jgi:hypothetical protein
VAGRIEGLPHRFGSHPSAYAVSFHGPGALSWLPAHWVSADRPGRSRFDGPRHLAMATESRTEQSELAHPSAVAPNAQVFGGPGGGGDDVRGISRAMGSVIPLLEAGMGEKAWSFSVS